MSDTLFLFYKAFSQFLMPLGLVVIGFAAAALLLARKHKRTGMTLLVFCVAWLWFWSTPWWSDVIRQCLESQYHYRRPESYTEADAIVVLGGGVRGFAGTHLPAIDLNRTSDRELFASQLYKEGKSTRIILSGGADPVRRTSVQALAMKVFLINLGVPARAILLGQASRNTRENRDEVLEMVKQFGGKSILLVTSAMHMPRAMYLFSKTGLEVVPAPSDYEVVNSRFTPARLVPDAEALENSTRAVREILGLLYCKMGLD